MKSITRQELLTTKLLSSKARIWAYKLDNLAYLNKPMRLFGTSQKVEKGASKRDTYILYLQPAGKVARKTLCAGSGMAGCEAPCLISSGQLGMSTGQRAATKRTILWLLRPEEFKAQLRAEIAQAERKAIKSGIPALFRLNGTSDIDWTSFIDSMPASEFYDYSKLLATVRMAAKLNNYHVTYSGSMYSEQSKRAMGKAVSRGYNVAVAYNTKGLASDNILIPVTMVDFDETDLRPLDKQGAIGALKRKGSNKAQRALETGKSFFVTADNVAEFNAIIDKAA
jgi:hypothetical protein